MEHTNSGAGDYTLVDSYRELIETQQENPTLRVAYVMCEAGTQNMLPSDNTRWESTVGVITAVLDTDGRYHFSTIENLTMEIESAAGNGIPDAPDQIDFQMTNIHGR